MRDLKLNTVCEDAHCPNIGECWHHGTATFMILGDVCTRACAYCAVAHGQAAARSISDEPRRASPKRCEQMGAEVRGHHLGRSRRPAGRRRRHLRRHDPRDQAPHARHPRRGADSRTSRATHAPLKTVLDARPDVLNHNTETVPRLYRMARSGGKYARTLELLDRARTYAPDIPTKTGLMVGLGEEQDELVAGVPATCAASACSILTIGQYLRPSPDHAVMTRYYHPDEFAELKRIALGLGFVHVEAGPLVRSSYHAHEQADAAQAAR